MHLSDAIAIVNKCNQYKERRGYFPTTSNEYDSYKMKQAFKIVKTYYTVKSMRH